MRARADRHDRCQRSRSCRGPNVVCRNMTGPWCARRHPHRPVANWKSPTPDESRRRGWESEDGHDTLTNSLVSFMVDNGEYGLYIPLDPFFVVGPRMQGSGEEISWLKV